MRFVGALVVWVVIAVIVGVIFVYSGLYSVGADVPHWKVTRQLIGAVREHAIARQSAGITPPALDDAVLIKEGAVNYSKMCSGCHLAPGRDQSRIRDGLYPRPPNLTRFAPRPAEAFWIIKHGLKMTAMPSWSHVLNDHEIWSLVAYLQKQPKLSPAEYQGLIALPAAPASVN